MYIYAYICTHVCICIHVYSDFFLGLRTGPIRHLVVAARVHAVLRMNCLKSPLCICMYVHIYINICICKHTYVHMYIYIYICTHISYVFVYMYTVNSFLGPWTGPIGHLVVAARVHAVLRMKCLKSPLCICIYIYVYVNMYIYIHMYTYIYLYIYM